MMGKQALTTIQIAYMNPNRTVGNVLIKQLKTDAVRANL